MEEETMTRDEKGTSYDGEEIIKIMEPIFGTWRINLHFIMILARLRNY